jgi:hypothetical protein
MLAQMLREEGLEVTYEPPTESRSVESDLVLVALYVGDKVADATVGLSVDALVRKAVARFKDRLPQADVQIEEEI